MFFKTAEAFLDSSVQLKHLGTIDKTVAAGDSSFRSAVNPPHVSPLTGAARGAKLYLHMRFSTTAAEECINDLALAEQINILSVSSKLGGRPQKNV